MSFLLRQRLNNSNKQKQKQQHGSRSLMPALRAETQHRNPVRSSISSQRTSFAGGGGGQVQIQRPAIQQQKQQNQIKQKEVVVGGSGVQGVISMDDVMEDLRVLEQQQRESQRMLAAIKLTKKQHLEKQTEMEQTLAALKFANGESRAVLEQRRQVLSVKTRLLGDLKLRRESGTGDLKRLEEKLERAMATMSKLNSYKQKVAVAVVNFENVLEQMRKQKLNRVEALKKAEARRDDVKYQEQLHSNAIYKARDESQKLADKIMSIRERITGCEHDYANAKQNEAGAKNRLDMINVELHEEKKRMVDLEANSKRSIEVSSERSENIERRIVEMEKLIEEKKRGVTEGKECYEKILKDAYSSAGGGAIDDNDEAIIDISFLRDRMEAEETKLCDECLERDHLSTVIKDRQVEIQQTKERETNALSEVGEVITRCDDMVKVEESLKAEHEALVCQVEKETLEVEQLRKSAQELEEANLLRTKEMNDVIIGFKDQLTAAKGDESNLNEQVNSVVLKLENSLQNFVAFKRSLTSKISEAKEKMVKVAESVKIIQSEIKHNEALNFTDAQEKELNEIKKSHSTTQDGLKMDIAALEEEYPRLKNLIVLYDPDIDVNVQIKASIEELRKECNEMIEAARADRNTRLASARAKAKAKAEKEEKARLVKARAKEEAERVEKEKKARLAKAKAKEKAEAADKEEKARRAKARAEKEMVVQKGEEEEEEEEEEETNRQSRKRQRQRSSSSRRGRGQTGNKRKKGNHLKSSKSTFTKRKGLDDNYDDDDSVNDKKRAASNLKADEEAAAIERELLEEDKLANDVSIKHKKKSEKPLAGVVLDSVTPRKKKKEATAKSTQKSVTFSMDVTQRTIPAVRMSFDSADFSQSSRLLASFDSELNGADIADKGKEIPPVEDEVTQLKLPGKNVDISKNKSANKSSQRRKKKSVNKENSKNNDIDLFDSAPLSSSYGSTSFSQFEESLSQRTSSRDGNEDDISEEKANTVVGMSAANDIGDDQSVSVPLTKNSISDMRVSKGKKRSSQPASKNSSKRKDSERHNIHEKKSKTSSSSSSAARTCSKKELTNKKKKPSSSKHTIQSRSDDKDRYRRHDSKRKSSSIHRKTSSKDDSASASGDKNSSKSSRSREPEKSHQSTGISSMEEKKSQGDSNNANKRARRKKKEKPQQTQATKSQFDDREGDYSFSFF